MPRALQKLNELSQKAEKVTKGQEGPPPMAKEAQVINHFFKQVLFILTLCGIVACAHQGVNGGYASMTEDERAQADQEILRQVDIRLTEVIAKTKEAGPTAITYLSTELFLKANSAFMEGDYLTSSLVFRHLNDLVQDPFVTKKYAAALIRMGDLEEAKNVLIGMDKASKHKDESIRLILAGVYSGLENTVEAKKIYQDLLVKDPAHEEACLFLSKILLIEKNYADAEKRLLGCAKGQPKEGVYYYWVGRIYQEKGNEKVAQSYFEKSVQAEPTFSQGIFSLGAQYEQKGDFKKAKELYQNFLMKRPMDRTILTKIMNVLFVLEDYQAVIPYTEALADLEPENLNIKVKLGILYTESQRYSDAVSVFKELLVLAPDSDKILYYLGAIYQEEKKFETSIDYFSRIPTTSGLYSDSSVQVANMLNSLAQNEYLETHQSSGLWQKKLVSHVQNRRKELPAIAIEMGVIEASYYEVLEDYSHAVAILETVKDEKEFHSAHSYYLASLYEKNKNYEKSTGLIMDILEKDPKNSQAWNYLGYSMLERGESPSKAYEFILKAVQLNPEDGYIRDSLGWYYFKTGKTQMALKEITKAFHKAPEDVVISKHLAIIYHSLKDYSKSKTFLIQALKNSKYETEKRDISGLMNTFDTERAPASHSSSAMD